MDSISSLLLLFFFILACATPTALATACNSSDISHAYTPCDTDNKHSAYYYYNKPCDIAGGVQLSPTISDLSCDIPCSQGYYLPFGTTACAQCQEGQYSPGDGTVYSDWAVFPPEFRTSCDSYSGDPCSGWDTDELYVASGNNSDRSYIDSNLFLHILFIQSEGNSISFTFRVDAELRYDGLRFYIDNELVMPLSSSEDSWKTVRFNVTQGFHDFKWNYHKDRSLSVGEDRAVIRSIEVKGTSYHADECGDCPTGTFGTGTGNIDVCQPCAFNTYQPDEGKNACLPCPAGKIAFSEASQCEDLPACKQSDYIITKGACANGKQTTTYSFATLFDTPVCSSTDPESVALPATSSGSCFCEAGTYLSGSSCITCPSGNVYDGTSCTTCQPGNAAIPVQVYTELSAIPSGFTTGCDGGCDPSGWIPAGGRLYGGWGFINAMESYLKTTVEFNQNGLVEFDMTLECPFRGDCFLQFLITDNDEFSYSHIFTYTYNGVFRVPVTIPPGTYSVTWRFHMQITEDPDRAPVELFSVKFAGVPTGGAEECSPCPPGSGSAQAGASICELCPPGEYSDVSGSPCKDVGDGYFTDVSGSDRRIPCGTGTTSNEDHTDCVTDCHFAATDSNGTVHNYDLSPMYNEAVMYYAGGDSNHQLYWLQMCHRESRNGTCYREDGTQIETFSCQFVPSFNYAVDAGRVIGFSSLEDTPDMGLMVTFSEGDYCDGVGAYRKTVVTMLCDTSAGVGSPRAIMDQDIEYPPHSCQYNFEWPSVYACPVCRQEDYEPVVGDCVNGQRVTSYRRKRPCWGETLADVVDPCQNCETDSAGKTCSGHGQCDFDTGRCTCESQWSGSSCESCAAGYWGSDCLSLCPGKGTSTEACNSHGVCFYGVSGNGTCACSTGFTGAACDTCAEDFEGDDCAAVPATLTKVIPVWAIVVIVVGILGLVIAVVIAWRAKRSAEYKYTSLLSRQPMGMEPLEDEE